MNIGEYVKWVIIISLTIVWAGIPVSIFIMTVGSALSANRPEQKSLTIYKGGKDDK